MKVKKVLHACRAYWTGAGLMYLATAAPSPVDIAAKVFLWIMAICTVIVAVGWQLGRFNDD